MRSTDAKDPVLNHPAPTTAAHRSLSPVPSGLFPGKDHGERCRGCRDFAPCPCLAGAAAIGPVQARRRAGPDHPPPGRPSKRAASPISPQSLELLEGGGGKEISSRNPTPGSRCRWFSEFPFDLVN